MRDSAGFDEFYAASARRVVGQLYLMVGDLGEAEDAVQEAYARAWQRWGEVGRYSDPAGWVRRVAYRIAVSSWRRARNRLRAQLRSTQEQDLRWTDPDALVLVEALRQIPAAQRRALVLYHLIGLPVAEIASETGASVSAVKSRLSRGRRALAAVLDPKRVEEGDRHA
jgi:RNA polymerase sigma-70 factor, ECF subfamily